MPIDMHTDELTKLIETHLNRPSDVFWAVRDVKGKLTKGYWYRVWRDESRNEWVHFGFLGANYAQAHRAINRLKVD